MSKFNKSTRGAKAKEVSFSRLPLENSIRNHEGGMAFKHSGKTELLTSVATSLLTPNDRFYETEAEAYQRLLSNIHRVLEEDPIFVLKMASFARNTLYMRAVPMLLVSEYVNSGAHVPCSRKYLDDIVQRPDEIMSLVALSEKSITDGVRQKHSQFVLKGVRKAFGKFSEHQLKKYNSRYSDIKLRSAMHLIHPVPPAGMEPLYSDIASDNVGRDETDWWIRNRKGGMSVEDWECALDNMGYLGVLQSLTKLLSHGVSHEKICPRLTNPKAISKAKVFPFRYLTAMNALQSMKNEDVPAKSKEWVMKALTLALDFSASNVPTLPGKTLLSIDVSDSMTGNNIKTSKNAKSYSRAGDISCQQIATLLAATFLANNAKNTTAYLFAETLAEYVPDGDLPVLRMADEMAGVRVGGSTNAYLPIERAIQNKEVYDRIILLSDMQCYSGEQYFYRTEASRLQKATIEYKKRVAPGVKIYSIDLQGYGHAILPEEFPDTVFMAGWNEQVFKFIDLYEQGSGSMIDAIEKL